MSRCLEVILALLKFLYVGIVEVDSLIVCLRAPINVLPPYTKEPSILLPTGGEIGVFF